MPKTLLSIEAILAQLAATPVSLEEMTRGFSEVQLRRIPGPAEWSVSNIIAHIRASADMWGGRRILAMLAENNPTIRTINPDTWIKQTDYLALEVRESLRAFSTQRGELLAAMSPLPPEGWKRSATIVGAGRPFEVTVHIEGDAIARHERSHLKQIKRLASAVSN